MLEKKMWYAIQIGADDNDWGYGFETLEEAKAKAEEFAQDEEERMIRIAVIDQGEDGNADPICVEEIVIKEGN